MCCESGSINCPKNIIAACCDVSGWLLRPNRQTAAEQFGAAVRVQSIVEGAGEVVQLATAGAPPSVSIGRSAPCELVISDDPDLSRRHARIFWSDSTWMLQDLDSSNGTFIGEFEAARRLSGTGAIQDGEIFRVGLTRLRLGGAKNERVVTAAAAAAAIAKAKRS